MLYKASNLQASIVQESKDQILINNVSISLAENEFIGLIGTSGSGKSQLAYSLARINTFYGIPSRLWEAAKAPCCERLEAKTASATIPIFIMSPLKSPLPNFLRKKKTVSATGGGPWKR